MTSYMDSRVRMRGLAFVFAAVVVFAAALAVGDTTSGTRSPTPGKNLQPAARSPEIPTLHRAEPLPGLRARSDSGPAQVPVAQPAPAGQRSPAPAPSPQPSTSPPSPERAPAPRPQGGGAGGGAG
jgi:hypothetical protein